LEPETPAPAPETSPSTDQPPTSRAEATALGYNFVTNVSILPDIQRQTADYLVESGFEVYIDPVALDDSGLPIPDMASIWRRKKTQA
jgi:hypothetical protein